MVSISPIERVGTPGGLAAESRRRMRAKRRGGGGRRPRAMPLRMSTLTPRSFGGTQTGPPARSATALPFATLDSFGPENTLRTRQITPRLGAGTERARALALEGLEGVFNAPDRGQIARDLFQNLVGEASDARRLGTQQIGQDAARLGRLGSGVVTTSLGDLESRIQTGLQRGARRLSAEAAGQTLADRIRQVQAAQGVGGQLFGQNAALRGELRQERGFQDLLAREAQQNRIRQIAMENALLGQATGLGFGGDPSAALLGAAGQAGAGAEGAFGSAGDALRLAMLLRQAQGTGGTAGTQTGTFDPVSAGLA